jgi:hypothetical protein
MASLLADIRAWVLADSAIAETVDDRIRPRRLKQKETLPAIRLTQVGGISEEHLGGASVLRKATFQIDCYAATTEAADALFEAVRARVLFAVRGISGTTFFNAVQAQGDMRQHEEPRGDGNDGYDYISSQDFLVSYTR